MLQKSMSSPRLLLMERELSKDAFIPADVDDVCAEKDRAPGLRLIGGYRVNGRASGLRLVELGGFNICNDIVELI